MFNKTFPRAAHGLTLIELLVFIVIVGIAATAILGVFGSLTRQSASLLPEKQAQVLAASKLQEIMAQPFGGVMGYDNPAFQTVTLPNQPPAAGTTPVPALQNYDYQVRVMPSNMLPNVMAMPGDALLVAVTVRLNGTQVSQLQGVRVNY